MFKQSRLLIHDFDSQALTSALPDEHRFEFPALYTLQHRLARNAEFEGCFQHRQILRRRLRDDARAQFVGDSDLPGCPRSDLLAGNAAVEVVSVIDLVSYARFRASIDGLKHVVFLVS